MILFIAPNPFKVKKREGYLQRVAAIDELFKSEVKYYSGDCQSADELSRRIIDADLIYVHSIYRAEEIIDCYPIFGHKIITDLHGVVPEEEALIGEERRAKELSTIERRVIECGAVFVSVTDTMAEHFKKKYVTAKKKQWVTLPIFETVRNQSSIHTFNHTVVYAGGAQKWQNVDLIVDAINKSSSEYRFDILTHTPAAFEGINEKSAPRVSIATIPSAEVGKHYKKADLGFVLRDDITVNRVACPTKLIEYLSYGVVPIVKSPHIGDFYNLGYKYVELKEFIAGEISADTLSIYAKTNMEVVEKLVKATRRGERKLLRLSDKIRERKTSGLEEKQIIDLVSAACSNSTRAIELNAAKYQISEQIRIISEYGKAVEYYQNKENDGESKIRNLRQKLHLR